jgi:hypothetical protein
VVNQSAGIVFNFAINTFTFNGTTNVTKSVSYPEAGALSTIDTDVKKDQVSVYPNPGSDFITLASKESIKKIKVTSLDGRTVLTAENPENIDISKLPKGGYILQGELKKRRFRFEEIYKKIKLNSAWGGFKVRDSISSWMAILSFIFIGFQQSFAFL